MKVSHSYLFPYFTIYFHENLYGLAHLLKALNGQSLNAPWTLRLNSFLVITDRGWLTCLVSYVSRKFEPFKISVHQQGKPPTYEVKK